MRYDFAIVGAGMAGASAAFALALHGRVCVLEAEAQTGFHATGRSAALFAPTYGGPEIRAITRASRAFLQAPPAGFADTPLLRARGCLYVAQAAQRERLFAMVESIRRSGGEVELLDAAQARELVPLLRQDRLDMAALDRDAMDIDVDALHQAFLKGARARDAVIYTGRPLREARREAGVWSISAGSAEIQADVLINAAGAWADDVTQRCGGRSLGLEAKRRTAVLVDPPPGVKIAHWPAVIDADENFYFKPDAGKLLLSPADETPDQARDVQAEELDIAIGVDRVQAVLDIAVRRVAHSWAGLRTFAPDRIPVVGYDPGVPGLFWCAGQGGYGIQTAPALGRLTAALARRASVPADLLAEGLAPENLSPDRFLLGPEGAAAREGRP